jgi:hypothetical protein
MKGIRGFFRREQHTDPIPNRLWFIPPAQLSDMTEEADS